MNSSICGLPTVSSEISPPRQRPRMAIVAWVLPLLLLVSSAAVKADPFGDFTFTSDGTAVTITGYTGTGGAIVIPETINGLPVSSIGVSAFSGSDVLTSVNIPTSVTSIGNYAFSFCSGLTSVLIPNGVTTIGGSAFRWCDALTSLEIPSSVTSIGVDAFHSCNSLREFTVSAANSNYSSLNGVLFNKNGTILIQCPATKSGFYNIPDGVLNIASMAFNHCSEITRLTLPGSVTTIGSNAFHDCSALTDLSISNGVTTVEQYAFSNCTALKNVVLPESVVLIEWGAYSGCTNLRSATLLGDAPELEGWPPGENVVFEGAAPGFTIYFDPSKTGYTTPIWEGYATVPLATTREIAVVSQSGTSFPDGGAAHDFGEVFIGASHGLAFTIQNLGATDLTGLAIIKDGNQAADFTVSSLEKTTLTPGDETTFSVTFAPGSPGGINAAIRIASNDADENPFDIPLTGEGLNRVAPFRGTMRIASTVNEDFEPAIGMALDGEGNRLVTGWFDGTNDFGGVSLSSLGGQDVFVGKYNPAGALVWARRAGGTTAARDTGRGIGVDTAGNVYVTGGFSGSADFGSFSLTASQQKDFFLAKYDSTGTVQWVRQNTAGALSDSAYGTGLALDGSGNSYAIGYYDGASLRFGATTLPAPAEYQCFLVKHNSAGTLQWARALTASGQVYATKLALDSLGNVCVGGGFSGSMNLDGTVLASAGGRDLFVAKFSSAGVLQWARRAGGTGKEEGEGGVAIDSDDNLIFGGAFESASIDFGGTVLTNSGGMDAFIAKYDPSGTVLWARKNGTSGLDIVASLAVDEKGYSYAAGVIGSAGGTAGVAKYDRNGTLQWEYAASGAPADPVASIAAHCAVDPAGNCHLVGWYQGQATFGNQALQPQGFLNYFLTTIPADPFAGVYPDLAWEGHSNVIYLDEDGIERSTEGYLKIVQNDTTHYAAEIREGPNSAVIPNLVRTGNRLQLDVSSLDMGTFNIPDFIMLSDGTNHVFAITGQEEDDPTDVSITVHSWSNHTGTITAGDFVGNWTFRSNGDDMLDPDDHFSGFDDNQFEIRETDADSIELVTPWGYSLPMRVSGNEAFLEAPTLIPGHPKYFSFRICTDGQKLSFHTIGKDLADNELFAVVGLGVKQATHDSEVAAWLLANGLTASADLQSDPNKDGVPLAVEYGLDLNPGVFKANPATSKVESNRLALDFSIPEALPAGVRIYIEEATALDDWRVIASKTSDTAWITADGAIVSEGAVALNRFPVIVRSGHPLAESNMRFMRLGVEMPTEPARSASVRATFKIRS